MNEDFNFQSVLADSITGFIAEKQAVGYKFKKGISILQRFDAYVFTLPLKTEELTKDTVLQWAERSPYETLSTQTGRISLMRGLAEYMNRIGKSAYIYP
jgi:integrase/recombinase XerD